MQKKKRKGHLIFYFVCWLCLSFILYGSTPRRPAKKHKETFLFLVLLCDQKYQKSYKRAFLPLIYLLPRARVSRTSHAWQVRAAKGKAKVGSFALSEISYYHACEHITRNSRADSCTHCLHARIIRWAGVNRVSTLTGWSTYFLLFLLAVLGFYLVGANIVRPRET